MKTEKSISNSEIKNERKCYSILDEKCLQI